MTFNKNKTKQLMIVLLVLLATACSASENELAKGAEIDKTKNIELQVYKSPTCGCCTKWMDSLDINGFKTVGHDNNNMNLLKDEKGVPTDYRSCHTATTKDGYVFEGHVPAKFISKFLQEKPKGAVGLVVPGMPVGSPGMEYQNKFNAYEILLIMKDGSVAKYAQVNTIEEQF